MHDEEKLKLRLHNTSYCLIEVVTKAGLTVKTDLYDWIQYVFRKKNMKLDLETCLHGKDR